MRRRSATWLALLAVAACDGASRDQGSTASDSIGSGGAPGQGTTSQSGSSAIDAAAGSATGGAASAQSGGSSVQASTDGAGAPGGGGVPAAAGASGGASNAPANSGGRDSSGGQNVGGMAAAGAPIVSGGSGGAPPGGSGGDGGGNGGSAEPVSLLVFSKTAGFRHDSIGAGVAALSQLADDHGWTSVATEDAARFNQTELAGFTIVVFLNTTGDVLNESQQAAFEAFIRSGGGFVGIHAASDTEFDWPWFGELVGAYFNAHPAIQQADILVDDATHLATAHLTTPWKRTDEWYGFQSNPRANVSVLLSMDESSYDPGDGAMNGDHPIAWFHEYDGGRVFYTALGHTTESYSEPAFLQHVVGGIEWVSGQ